ncbi:MAG: hypothetical protein GXP53_06915 [Deltaproteobacteria bacterium]|nr:hypothetical protein [Deltaproteobacteria bacterium]
MWFETLTGFHEKSPGQVHENLSIDGNTLKSHVNGRKFSCGKLETPSLAELRKRVSSDKIPAKKISVHEVIANVQTLHKNKSNAGALFQVASQFNLLEMVSPNVTPEHGVGNYENDPTQGPACAIAAGAGTIYRNYFAKVNGQTGQSRENQIDCLADLGAALGNSDNHLWVMKNGYALATEDGLREITNRLKSEGESGIDELRKKLRIGIQWNTEVTISDSGHTVSQAYCSALPVAYLRYSSGLWSEFAKLVLEASYEATICAGIVNCLQSGNNTVYLTLVGGGAFGNKSEWIMDALYRALALYNDSGLDVVIVSYGHSNKYVRDLVRKF